ncbi:MAG TPA: hypothetical protein VN824_02825 [Puia sp.]|nr:hypothetical protein [Puia sp.]
MTSLKKLFLLVLLAFFSARLQAQIEVAHLMTKGMSSTGFGTYIHGAFPIGQADDISIEAGLYYFAPSDTHVLFVPLLLGYRHTLDKSGAGFYVEPFGGYSLGATDIQQTDANGSPVYNSDGTSKDVRLSGATAGLGFGYIIPSPKVPINFGLRYEHIFVTGGGPAQSLLALRISWSLLTGRRLQSR